jgi:putative AlgH/UPF0301 family transcriptional regulator
MSRCPCLISALLSLLTLATLSPASPAAGGKMLAGQVLVASEAIGDPLFDHTVIYIVKHERTGALGLIVNRPR